MLVVGGGVIGRSVGHHLAQRGVAVDVIDAGDGLSKTSRASLGILTHPNGGDNPYSDLYRDGHRGYAQLAEQIRVEAGVDIGWRPLGGLDLNFDDADEEAAAADREFNLARGCPTEWLEAAQVRQLEPGVADSVRSGLFFAGDHRVNPEKLAKGLQATMELNGGRLITGEALEAVLHVDETGVDVKTTTRCRGADFLVLAAGCWTRGIGAGMQADIAVHPVRGQHGRFDNPQGATSHILRHGGLQSVPSSGQVVVGATTEESGFDASTTAGAADRFQGYWSQVFAPAAQILSQRAGLRPKPKGGRPMIGPLPNHPRVFVATGHYKNGILLGPISGQLIAEWIIDGRPSRPMEAFAVRG